MPPSSSGLGYQVLILETGVRLPLGVFRFIGIEQAFSMEMPDNMIKRIIKKTLFCLVCSLSLFIYCDFDDDDDDHHHHDSNDFSSSLWRQEQHKEYELRLSSGRTEPNDFTAGV